MPIRTSGTCPATSVPASFPKKSLNSLTKPGSSFTTAFIHRFRPRSPRAVYAGVRLANPTAASKVSSMNGQKFSKSTATFTGIRIHVRKESGSAHLRDFAEGFLILSSTGSVLIQEAGWKNWNFVKRQNMIIGHIFADLPSLLKRFRLTRKALIIFPICTVCSVTAASLSLNRWNTQRRQKWRSWSSPSIPPVHAGSARSNSFLLKRAEF